MKAGAAVGVAAGLLLLVFLLLRFGLPGVASALGLVGWRGLAGMIAVHLPSMALCGLAWRLAAPAESADAGRFVLARWIRDGAGSLIAVLPMSGELAGARALTRLGVPAAAAAGSVVVDLTMELSGQFLFTLLGLALLFIHDGRQPLLYWAGVGLLVALPALVGFLLFQRSDTVKLIERASAGLAHSLQWPLLRGARSLQDSLHAAYRRPGRLTGALVLHFSAWVVGALETWLALELLRIHWSFWQVLVVESMTFALRTAVFVVPNGLGVQEGGYVAAGALFGLSPRAALALAILKRGRELVLAVPSLAAWRALERPSRTSPPHSYFTE